MPKIKTHKGAQRRFHITGTGKIMRAKGGQSHFRIRKAKRTKRLYDEMIQVSSTNKAMIKRLLPYKIG